ncbi:MAG: hypothetical protein HZC46_10595 [Ignavibacterium album]|jgi:predicted Fe-Mo cluster-binding NifX family protein|uniref:NifB/NifX family molybdenum-iron cluster-binding protein n=1 Tax=Ignavibacterium album TaxID=591197 RepID=UPI0026F06085|nr:NifB/NifX family molybdenum-iron cluster-binding protein [Ignavibacterium album]MBI5662582.1 hypothetical protein [Ignavibacterium album]
MNKNLKVAFATNDGITTFAHLGRAKYFEVIEVKDGKIQSRERREKPDFHSGHHHDHNNHGEKHNKIFSLVEDCDYIIAGGMGYGIYDFLSSRGKQAIVTTEKNIDDVLEKLLSGNLVNHVEKLH